MGFIEDKAAGKICAEIEKKAPSVPAAKCEAFVEAGWEKLVAKCPKEVEVGSIPSVIEGLFCKVASLKFIEDKAAGKICAEIEKKVPSVPAAKCEAFVEAGWEKLVAKCPKEVVEVVDSPCCQGSCKVAGEEKYYSVAKSLFGTKHCGECCMNPSKYNLYHIFEKNLTKADNDSPCSTTFGYTKYDSTATHGFGPVKMTLDLYDLPSEVVV